MALFSENALYRKGFNSVIHNSMLQSLFSDCKQHLGYFFDQIDLNPVELLLEKLLACQGFVFFTGVGKSGHIAQKIAATFVSTGTRAAFLAPDHALHGDIGILSPHDMLCMFSKSGESEELLSLLPYARKKGSHIVAIVSAVSSRLATSVEHVVHLPIPRELCPYDLAPTISTTAQLIFGDCLAIALMQKKQFSLDAFAANHPAGFLGKKITLKVADLMLQKENLPLCAKTDKLIDVLHEFTVKRCGCLLVVDEKNILHGIFTDGDLRRAIAAHGENVLRLSMEVLMTTQPTTTAPEQSAFTALRQMEANPLRLITVLPVVQQEKVVGLLRVHDILQAGLH